MTETFLVKLENADVVLTGTPILKGINWLIEPGQHWRIEADNGAGKTTLLKTVAGLLWPVAKQPVSRHYGFDNKVSHLLAGVKDKIGFASYGMQDEYVRGSRNIDCHEVIASGFEQNIMVYQQLSSAQEQSIEAIAQSMGLLDLLNRSFLSISHGQKSAVLFARALIHQPKLLILDEIFNGVDHQRFDLMVELLHNYKHTGGQILFSWHEHGVAAIEEIFTHQLTLSEGKVISSGQIRSRSRTAKLPSRKIVKSKTETSKKLIQLEKLNVYLQNQHILKDIDWTIYQGERWLLKGKNGAGKTTLIKTLLAEIRPSVDSIIRRSGFDNRSSVWQIRSLMGYVSPELQQAYHYNVSVFEVVASGFFSSIGLYDQVDAAKHQAVQAVLVQFDLEDLEDTPIHEVSSGQMRRVLIARAMVNNPEMLIFDEITANLDQASRQLVLDDIARMIKQGKTMIFVGHHENELAGYYNRVLNMIDGRTEIGSMNG